MADIGHNSGDSILDQHAHKRLHGTQPLGEASHNAKLTTSDVVEARKAWQPGRHGFGTHVLAKRYGVSQRHMHDVLTGRRWGRLPGARP